MKTTMNKCICRAILGKPDQLDYNPKCPVHGSTSGQSPKCICTYGKNGYHNVDCPIRQSPQAGEEKCPDCGGNYYGKSPHACPTPESVQSKPDEWERTFMNKYCFEDGEMTEHGPQNVVLLVKPVEADEMLKFIKTTVFRAWNDKYNDEAEKKINEVEYNARLTTWKNLYSGYKQAWIPEVEKVFGEEMKKIEKLAKEL